MRYLTLASIIAAGTVLSGCWASQDLLLDPARAAHPQIEGHYRATDPSRWNSGQAGDPGIQLTWKGDGWFEYSDLRSDSPSAYRLMLEPLNVPGQTETYAVAIHSECKRGQNCAGPRYLYRVMRIRNGHIEVLTLGGNDASDRQTAQFARASGATESKDWIFPSRESLLKALRAAAQAGPYDARYERDR